jgi:hypothetical protein
MTWVHRTMIVPAAFQPLAAALTAGIAGSSGAGMFQVPAAATPEGPTTHYSSSGYIQQSFADLMPLDQIVADEQGVSSFERVNPGQPQVIVAAAQQAGSPVPLAMIQALLAAVIVCDAEGWQSAYGVAGLVPVVVQELAP